MTSNQSSNTRIQELEQERIALLKMLFAELEEIRKMADRGEEPPFTEQEIQRGYLNLMMQLDGEILEIIRHDVQEAVEWDSLSSTRPTGSTEPPTNQN